MAYKKNKKLLNYKQLGFSLHDKKTIFANPNMLIL
jgi:uncharacterized DUF497 family protein